YRFPLPDCKLSELEFQLHANAFECKDAQFLPKEAKQEASETRLAFSRVWKNQGPGGEAVFAFTPAKPQVQVISGRQSENGPLYLYARVRPELKTAKDRPFAHHGIFLLDTSLSEHPDRFALSMALLRKVLESDADLKHFNILTFNVGAAWVQPTGWLENTSAGREKAFAQLDGLVLEGATDFGSALKKLAQPGFPIDVPVNVFVLSDGQITWGEPDAGPLVARFEKNCPFPTRFHCYRFGLGADNLELFQALTRRGGGVFNCFGEADLTAAATAHRHQCLQVEHV